MKFSKQLFLAILLLVCVSVSCQITDEEYAFIDIEKGISQKAISTIVQDQNGVVWIGSYGGGLYKNFGAELKTYRQEFNNPHSLNSSLIQNAYVDSNNRIWVGTEVGLNVYDEDLDQFNRVKFKLGDEVLESTVVWDVIETDDGHLLAGTNVDGLFKVNTKSLIASSVPLVPRPEKNLIIKCFKKRDDGKILIGTNKGLFEFNGKNATPIALQGVATEKGLPFGIESMLIDDSGSLWLGTFSSGLLKVEADKMNTYQTTHLTLTNERVFAMAQAPDGNILCATENDGLLVLKKDGYLIKNYKYDKFEVNGIKSNSIWSVFVDREERIWMGYYNAGVSVYDRSYDKFKDLQSVQNVQNSLQSSSVTSIVKDKKNRLWIGMDGGGIDVYDPKNKHFTHLIDPNNPIATGLDAVDVQNLFYDSSGNLWVATWNSGVYYLKKDSREFKHFEIESVNDRMHFYRVMNFAEDIEGVVWIGTSASGLYFYDTKKEAFGSVPDDDFNNEAEIRKVLVDRENTIWVATNKGLFKRSHSATKPFEKVDLIEDKKTIAAEKSMLNMVVSLCEDRYGNIWIGTDGAGLWKHDFRSKEITWFNRSSSNLEQENVVTILESDEGVLWVGGNNGLSYLNSENDKFVNFNTNDGLLSNDFNYNASYKDENGIMYFGNYEGINIVDPKRIVTNENRPPIYFTDLKIHNKSTRVGDKNTPLTRAFGKTDHIELGHQQSVFTIEFAAVNYTRPEKNQYAYFLEGLEETWNFVGNTTTAHYTNLSPGDYTFRVKASNNDGVWNEEVKSLSITVLPPWWKTHMAFACYFIMLGSVTLFATRLVRDRLREKRIAQLEREKRLQEEELNSRKIQFFTNISHEFRTPLTLILNPLEAIISERDTKLPVALKDKLLTVRKNTGRLKRLIDELMDFRKLQLNKFSLKVSKIDAVDFTKEVVEHFKEEATLKNIALMLETPEEDISVWSDQGMLEKVLFNILSNAFKITPDNGTITVGLSKCEKGKRFPLVDDKKPMEGIEIFIEDTGSGISQEEVKNVFERFYQVKNMNSQYYGGTGIGLEVVKSFVDLLKGTVEVESEETVGTKFRIFLPLGKEHFEQGEFLYKEPQIPLEESGSNSTVPKPIETFNNASSKKTVLLVEDNTELRSYLRDELQHEYKVLEAANGILGLEMAAKKTPHLIITDVVMPEMDGFEFSEEIKKDIKTSHIPIVMLTAKTMNEDWVKGIESGADIYLSKPFDMTVLRTQLRRLLTSRQILLDKFGSDGTSVKIPEHTTQLDKNFIEKVIDFIVKNIADENLNVELLAEELNLSRSQLYRKIKALTGCTANEFLRKLRLEKAKEIIEKGDASISEVCFQVGFSSPSYFTKCFKAHFGILPTELKQD